MENMENASGKKARKPEGIIISSWKGIAYIKSRPLEVANPRTPGQVRQRNKMSLSMEFLKANILMLRSGFRLYKAKRSAFNAALSYTLSNGFTGQGNELEIDYSRVLLSRGQLQKPLLGKFSVVNNEVVVTWDGQTIEDNAGASDRAMIAVYDPINKESLTILRGLRRVDGSRGQKIALPDSFNRDSLKVFLAFNSFDEVMVSESVLCEETLDL